MADELLSQDEISALLDAAKSGEIEEHLDSDEPEGINSQIQIRKYDFRGPGRIATSHRVSMQLLHGQLARNLGSAFSTVIRTLTEVECYSVEQLKYSDFLMSVSEPSCLVVLTMSPLKGLAVMEISPQLLFPVLERLLGGSGQGQAISNRAITEIEKIIIGQLLEIITEGLSEVWSKAVPDIKVQVERIETDPQYVQVVSSNETIMLVVFDVRFSQASGMISLCFPFPMVERALAGALIEQQFFANERSGGEYRPLIERGVSRTEVDVRARFAPTVVPIRDIISLKEGDVLALDVQVVGNQIVDKLQIKVGGKLRFMGKLGRCGKRRAVKITNVVEPDDYE